MDRNQRNAIERLACEFFQSARKYVSKIVGDTGELRSVFGESRVELGGPLFGMDDSVRQKQEELVETCVRVLGVELGSEEELEELAWKHVWTSLLASEPLSDVTRDAREFAERVSMHQRQSYGYIAPNHVLKFTGEAERILIGPVEAMKAARLIDSQKDVPRDKTIWERMLAGESAPAEFQIGSKFDFSISDNRILIEIPGSCWFIPIGAVRATRRNAEENALWLIDIAISLLRLCHPNPRHSEFPKSGDIEDMSIDEPKEYWLGFRRNEKGLVLGEVSERKDRSTFTVGLSAHVKSRVRRVYCSYVVDEAVVEVTEEQGFKERAEHVFRPGKRSLAERFGQGLGWLTRARQSSDRAERLLFFFTAIEALLCSDDSNAPVVQTICRNAAVVLCDSPDRRAEVAGRLRKLYDSRSALVHAGKRSVSQAQSIEVQGIAEEVYRTVMECCPLDGGFEDFQNSLSRASYGLSWP